MTKKKTVKKKSAGKKTAKNSLHYKAESWGMAREKFKREKRGLVFKTAKKCPTHSNCYIVKYGKRKKDTKKPSGNASTAVNRIWGGKKKTTKKKTTKKKTTKKKAVKKKTAKKKTATKKRTTVKKTTKKKKR